MTNKKGFTLLEVIVAMFVVNVALLALLSLMSYASITGRVSADRLIALNLAQEGIEIVRNSRDATSDWTSWFSGTPDGDYRAGIALTSPYNWLLERNPASYQLRYNQSLGLYHYQSNGDPLSIFSRKIQIVTVSANQKKIIATVSWTNYGKNYSIVVEDWLYKWR